MERDVQKIVLSFNLTVIASGLKEKQKAIIKTTQDCLNHGLRMRWKQPSEDERVYENLFLEARQSISIDGKSRKIEVEKGGLFIPVTWFWQAFNEVLT